MPELKSFLKDGEAESFQGVSVEFIHGRKAVLTIFHDGVEKEQITLSDLKTKNEMHLLFFKKGFERKSDEEVVAARENALVNKLGYDLRKRRRLLKYFAKQKNIVYGFKQDVMNTPLGPSEYPKQSRISILEPDVLVENFEKQNLEERYALGLERRPLPPAGSPHRNIQYQDEVMFDGFADYGTGRPGILGKLRKLQQKNDLRELQSLIKAATS